MKKINKEYHEGLKLNIVMSFWETPVDIYVCFLFFVCFFLRN